MCAKPSISNAFIRNRFGLAQTVLFTILCIEFQGQFSIAWEKNHHNIRIEFLCIQWDYVQWTQSKFQSKEPIPCTLHVNVSKSREIFSYTKCIGLQAFAAFCKCNITNSSKCFRDFLWHQFNNDAENKRKNEISMRSTTATKKMVKKKIINKRQHQIHPKRLQFPFLNVTVAFFQFAFSRSLTLLLCDSMLGKIHFLLCLEQPQLEIYVWNSTTHQHTMQMRLNIIWVRTIPIWAYFINIRSHGRYAMLPHHIHPIDMNRQQWNMTNY